MKNKTTNPARDPKVIVPVTLAIIAAVVWIAFLIGGSAKIERSENLRSAESATTAVSTTSAATSVTTSATAASTSTTAVTTTVTTASTTVPATTTAAPAAASPAEEKPQEQQNDETQEENSQPAEVPQYTYVSAGESPNSDFYQNRVVVFGDSIAYGFNVYGYIPYEHNLAKESVSMWNMGAFTFDKGGGEMSMTDAAAYISPSLIYMSLGMNDVPGLSPDDFASRYRAVIEELQAKIPGVSIVVAGITPVSASCTYTTSDRIREFNSALDQMVADMNSQYVWYFDAYSVCANPGDLTLRSDASGGDGIHLYSGTYGEVFGALFNFLDTTPVMDNMLAKEGG